MAAEKIPQLQPDAGGAPQARPPGYIQDYAGGSGAGGVALAQGGQAIAQGLDEASRTLTGVALEAKKQNDQSIVMGAFKQLGDVTVSLLNDPGTNPDGTLKGALFTRQGQALGVVDRTLPKYDRAATEIQKTLTDPEQRLEFNRYLVNHRTDVARQLAIHEGTQLQAQDDANTRAALETNVQQAAMMFKDPLAIDRRITDAFDMMQKRAGLQKWTPDQLALAKRDMFTAIVDSVVRNAAVDNALYAKGLLQRYVPLDASGQPDSSQFDGRKYDELTKLIRQSSLSQESGKWAPLLRQENPDALDKQVQQAYARIGDADLRNHVVEELGRLKSVDDKARTDRVARLFSAAESLLLQQPRGERRLTVLPASLVTALRYSSVPGAADAWAHLEQLELSDKRGEAARPPDEAQRAAEGWLIRDMQRQPRVYREMDPAEFYFRFRSQLTADQYDRLAQSQAASAKRGGTIALPEPVERMMKDLGADAGLWPSDKHASGSSAPRWTMDHYRRLSVVRDELRKYEDAWQSKNGDGEPPQQEYLKWINDVLIKGTVVGGGAFGYFDKQVPYVDWRTNPKFEDTSGNRKVFRITDPAVIPQTELRQIDNALRSQGVMPTTQKRLDLYNAVKYKLPPLEPLSGPPRRALPPQQPALQSRPSELPLPPLPDLPALPPNIDVVAEFKSWLQRSESAFVSDPAALKAYQDLYARLGAIDSVLKTQTAAARDVTLAPAGSLRPAVDLWSEWNSFTAQLNGMRFAKMAEGWHLFEVAPVAGKALLQNLVPPQLPPAPTDRDAPSYRVRARQPGGQ